MRVDSWKQGAEEEPLLPKQSPEVQVAAPEHVGKLTLLRVTEAPFLTTLRVWPPMVAEALVDVGDANVRTKAAEVRPPQAPVSGTVADTWVPDCVAVKVPLIQQHDPVLHWLVTW